MIKKIYFLLFFFVFTVFFYSCKQQLLEGLDNMNVETKSVDNPVLVASAKQYYQKEIEEQMLTGFTSKIAQTERGKVTPPRVYALWQKVSISENRTNHVLELPVRFSHRTVSLIKISRDSLGYTPDRTMIKTIFDRSLIIKNKKGELFSAKVVRYHPDRDFLARHDNDLSHVHLYALDGFTGYLEYMTTDGQRKAVIRVVNGKPVKRYRMQRKSQPQKAQSMDPATKSL